ncbi:amidohydrolase family protein [Skermania piniformis]|uniref:Amidohydrolase family protein n=2 Tax=Skermania pinensis TaxID=39122 RepID=A0ABX8SGR8_9ACTN|nr:amidohydrolase family protein [Skermania piniformis]
MATDGDTVVWLGADRPGRALYPDAEVIDLAGAFVAPAFVDPHVHVTALGLQLTGLDLTGVRSRAELLLELREYAARATDAVLFGQGWDDTEWPDRTPPTGAELTAAAAGRPVYLTRVDVHSALVAGLPGAPPATESAVVCRAAHHDARAAAHARLTAEQRDRARRAALDHAAARGVAAVHECAGPQIAGRDDLRELLALQHGVDVRGYWGEAVTDPEQARTLIDETGAAGLAGDLFVDGSLGSHTAWLREPYADTPDTGTAYLDVATITAHIRACTLAGTQAGFHAIGDAAVDAVVAGFGRVVAELGGPAVAARGHRIEHLEMIDAECAGKLAAWGVIASVQPGFDAGWGGPDGMYAARLGPQRAAAMNPFATLAAAGVPMAIGSDAPVTPIRPWAAVRAAVRHRTPGSGISPRAAFAAATRGAWRAGGVRDGVAGTLVPGAPASYAVWAVDRFATPEPGRAGRAQRWSTDPRSGVPALPQLDGVADPICLRTVHHGVVIHDR